MATAETVFRDALLQAGINQLASTATAKSYLRLENAGASALATLYFASPAAFASANVAAGAATATAITGDTSAVAGTLAAVMFYNAVNAKQLAMTVATSTASATDFVISTLTINSGDQITCTALTMTVPAT